MPVELKNDIGAVIAAQGWTGPRAWRLDTIFRTNIQTAYNVGRYKQLQDAADILPYWQYSAVNDSRTRPAHAAMDGKIFRQDDPIWDEWYPPNGFNCRCSVIAVSQAEAERQGLKIEDYDPDKGVVYDQVDEVTGEMTPEVARPDDGWRYNPGQAGQMRFEDAFGQTLARLSQGEFGRRLADRLLSGVIGHLAGEGDKAFADWVDWLLSPANRAANGKIMTRGEQRTIGFVSPEIAAAVVDVGGQSLKTALITARDDRLLHSAHLGEKDTGYGRGAKGRILDLEDIKNLPAYLRSPEEVYYDAKESGLVYVFPAQGAGKVGKAAVKVNFTEKKSGLASNAYMTGAVLDETTFKGPQYIRIYPAGGI